MAVNLECSLIGEFGYTDFIGILFEFGKSNTNQKLCTIEWIVVPSVMTMSQTSRNMLPKKITVPDSVENTEYNQIALIK